MSKERVLKIKTSTDSTETEIVRVGKVEETANGLILRYHEETAEVEIRIYKERADLFRQGDYNLKLPLEQGKKTIGLLGLGGNEGEIEIFTREIFVGNAQGLMLVKLDYDLYFGQEKQEMKLRILIK